MSIKLLDSRWTVKKKTEAKRMFYSMNSSFFCKPDSNIHNARRPLTF